MTAVALSPTLLVIQWSPPSIEHQNGLIRRYAINVTELETMNREMTYSEGTNVTLSSRHPFYRYSYSVSAETISLGPFSADDTIRMPEAGE